MQIFLKNKYVLDVIATIMFFTRIPVNWSYFSDKQPDLTSAAWAFPLVGLFIGVLSGAVGDIFIYIGLPTFLCCVISITLSIFLTGAFHEDGLADTLDGLGAGGTPKRINKIIHDSRLGTYGVSALILAYLFRLGILLSLVDAGYSLVSILSVAFASGKIAIIFARNFFDNSIFAKTGSIVEVISNKNVIIATLIWVISSQLIFPFIGILVGSLFMTFVIFIIGNKSKKALGGITGDILGAISLLTEIVFLFGIVITVIEKI